MPILTMQDLRRAGHCANGIRLFFAQHNLDLGKLVREGIPTEELEHIDDVNLQEVIREIKKEV